MTTYDLIDAIREDIKRDLRSEIMAELQPEIERRLYANIFTFGEAVQYLKVSETTLRRMVASKEVPHFKQRDKLYFRQSDLDQYVSGLVKVAKAR